MLFAPINKGGSSTQGRVGPNAGTGTGRHGGATVGGRAGADAAGHATGADAARGRAPGAPGVAPGVTEVGLLQEDGAQEWTGLARLAPCVTRVTGESCGDRETARLTEAATALPKRLNRW